MEGAANKNVHVNNKQNMTRARLLTASLFVVVPFVLWISHTIAHNVFESEVAVQREASQLSSMATMRDEVARALSPLTLWLFVNPTEAAVLESWLVCNCVVIIGVYVAFSFIVAEAEASGMRVVWSVFEAFAAFALCTATFGLPPPDRGAPGIHTTSATDSVRQSPALPLIVSLSCVAANGVVRIYGIGRAKALALCAAPSLLAVVRIALHRDHTISTVLCLFVAAFAARLHPIDPDEEDAIKSLWSPSRLSPTLAHVVSIDERSIEMINDPGIVRYQDEDLDDPYRADNESDPAAGHNDGWFAEGSDDDLP
jgi:hypothetical protein